MKMRLINDSNSNRISGTQNAELFTAVYDSQDRMLSYSQGEAPEKLFQYNLNGELTQLAQGSEHTSFTPDTLGRIKAVTLPDYSTLSYSLDHRGRRVQKFRNGSKVYRNIYEDEFKIAAEVGPLGQFKEYVYATNINSVDYIKDGSKHYRILKDHLGSPRLVVNASTGTIVQRMDYNEWGMVTLDTNPGFQPFGFAGGIYDQVTFPQSLLRSRLSKTLVICDLQFIWDLLESKNWWKDLKTERLVLSTRNLSQILRAFSDQLT